MTPATGPESPTTPTDRYDKEPSFPGLTRSATAPHGLAPAQQSQRSYLAPEDAYVTSPPRHHHHHHHRRRLDYHIHSSDAVVASGMAISSAAAAVGGAGTGRAYDSPSDRRGRSRSRRRKKKQYKKLLWVKQSYRDNYTDQATFLESLQRNPRLQPYQFWTLFADSTVIVQQVCAVTIFTVCFSLIFQERLSCSSVAAGGSLATFLGWVIWTLWEWREQDAAAAAKEKMEDNNGGGPTTRPGSAAGGGRGRGAGGSSATLTIESTSATTAHAVAAPLGGRMPHSVSATYLGCTAATPATASSSLIARRDSYSFSSSDTAPGACSSSHHQSRHNDRHVTQELCYSRNHVRHPSSEPPQVPSRHHSRQASYDPVSDIATIRRRSPRRGRWEDLVGTIKSSVLIVFFVGAVSPILKSLTRSFASDSIWAMSSFLLLINLFFFDYSIGIVQPAATVGVSAGAAAVAGGTSPSTIAGMPRSGPAAFALNSATMASTVLASRLPQTSQVFSLTIFSMEMFALFPIFRRYARHHSLPVHVALTAVLIIGAGAGVGIAFGSPEDYIRNAVRGLLISVSSSVLAMGGCSYWLISLQKYKNAIIGPWDPARPVITAGPAGALARMHFQQD
ncbi:GPI2-domain-containing protein [Zalerion maritima]|uniref:GPI2-domain-containing protein n=1 Tax=Zalerion maritima TaxID=339359 RepID=A0AAD5RTV9_9PEZI|nr:GPI2-domain-containing protein [Zalerion maritima]